METFLSFLQEALPPPEQVFGWIVDWIVFNPLSFLEILFAYSCLTTGTGILKSGLALSPIYSPPKRGEWFGFLKNEEESRPQPPNPIPVPAHAYWYHLIVGLIFIGLAIFSFWLASHPGGWF